jgi:Fur family peroxide stress response transcriptional regulator
MRRDTKQREAILKVLRNTRSHPTADQIYDQVRKDIPNISKGTIYRNLHILQEDGVIGELKTDNSQSRYEFKIGSHYHFRCEKCRKVIDLDEPVDKALDERVSKKTGFTVSHHQTEFRGLCKDCQ